MRNPVQITLSLVTSTALLFTGCVETIPDTRRSRDATSSEVDPP